MKKKLSIANRYVALPLSEGCLENKIAQLYLKRRL